MLTQTIILSATKYTIRPTVYMMQNDTGRVLSCAFSDFTVPEGATARLYIHRPNGTFYTETATVDGQVVTVDADQILTTAGYVNCDLEIEADDETVQSFPFVVLVLPTEAGSPQTEEKGVSVAELAEQVSSLDERVSYLTARIFHYHHLIHLREYTSATNNIFVSLITIADGPFSLLGLTSEMYNIGATGTALTAGSMNAYPATGFGMNNKTVNGIFAYQNELYTCGQNGSTFRTDKVTILVEDIVTTIEMHV